ncbi:dTMP kinase [Paenibacillus mucilaginosus]|uniref:Thymidylate kinase n=2 Tax=Paenibacillus mucilaginosus TaxID=61624 RepID=H6NSJ2_9BACL|nr:dTMP kinase [Paenibacillus mucilaginosus]AFC33742.1 Tmk [Paenibacillus mucilaginosus 3016]MCG7217925.1 dTMP kinase [Paenibacillus mucilaginosus]WDM27452.1 dTMP kinase [Paenibacillus mucilaginosus]WFA22138.1 dTMP kinase [Paenibacillus mucilaginosus]
MDRRGFFVTVEGGEGAGKTSAIGAIVQAAADLGGAVVSTREPGGIPIAEKIRELILDRSHTEMDSRTEALLYAAARRQHLTQRVIPALQSGQVVVCDRFIDSSLAYQGHARGLGMAEVLAVNAFAVEGWMPDLTLYMDVRPEVGLARIQADASRELNRLDLEKLEFHRKVREGYLQLLERYPERIVRIDAESDLPVVLEEIRRLVNQKLAGRV